MNQRPLGYELLQPPPITGLYEPPDGKSWHIAAGHATPAQPERPCRTPGPARTFQVGQSPRLSFDWRLSPALLFSVGWDEAIRRKLREGRRTVASAFSSSQFRNPSASAAAYAASRISHWLSALRVEQFGVTSEIADERYLVDHRSFSYCGAGAGSLWASPAALRVLTGRLLRPATAEPPPASRSTAKQRGPSESRTSLELPSHPGQEGATEHPDPDCAQRHRRMTFGQRGHSQARDDRSSGR